MRGLQRIWTYFCIAFMLEGVTADLHSCRGDCDRKHLSRYPCYCNDKCIVYGNCCHDYFKECNPQGMCARDCTAMPNLTTCQRCSFTNGGCVTDAELLDFSKRLLMFTSILNSTELEVNVQGRVRNGQISDVAPAKFFLHVDQDLIRGKSYQQFISLLDNYNPDPGITDTPTKQQRREEEQFLDLFLNSKIGRELFLFLKQFGLVGCGDICTFRQVLYKIWFAKYARKKRILGSSGFEHVFIGEYKNDKYAGLHNWISIHTLEEVGKLNYYGHHGDVDTVTPVERIQIQYAVTGHTKQLSTIRLGTQPEWEFAVYTLCFLTRPNLKCRITVPTMDKGSIDTAIKTYQWRKGDPINGLRYLASAFFY